MNQDDDQNECKEIRPSISQGAAPGCENEILENEIGGLFDELTQHEEK